MDTSSATNSGDIPAVLVAGTNSGVGKTTITLGLMAALRRRGLKVQPFKVGPDFIDPTHHTAICKRPSRNLDTFMMGIDGVRRSFARAVRGADVAVVEGVMGLYDGLGSGEVASTAEVAKALGIPVLLVVNVHGMSRSAAAVVKGFQDFDSGVTVAGVILNRVGSARHLEALRGSIAAPIIGAIPRRQEIALPSRHLGLQMAFESNHDLGALADLLEENADIDAILDQRCHLPPIKDGGSDFWDDSLIRSDGGVAAWNTAAGKVRLGIAMDEAFCFYYQDNLDMLMQLGVEIIPFSPLRERLPDVDGLYIGGGYPELHAAELEQAPARTEIKKVAEDGMPIYGECGGLMYLGRSMAIGDRTFRMSGALPGDTLMTGKLQALGYVEAEVAGSNPVVSRGSMVLGHEFHYSCMDCDSDARLVYRLRRGSGIKDGRDGLIEGDVLGGYLHAHFVSFKPMRFVEHCRAYRRR